MLSPTALCKKALNAYTYKQGCRNKQNSQIQTSLCSEYWSYSVVKVAFRRKRESERERERVIEETEELLDQIQTQRTQPGHWEGMPQTDLDPKRRQTLHTTRNRGALPDFLPVIHQEHTLPTDYKGMQGIEDTRDTHKLPYLPYLRNTTVCDRSSKICHERRTSNSR